MAKKKLSEQAQRLLDLKRDRPDATTAELADLLGVTTSAIYQSEGRLRESGHLPKLRGNKRTPRVQPFAPPPPSRNGHEAGQDTTIEAHLKDEIALNEQAIVGLELRLAEAQDELSTRRSRDERLKSAQQALQEQPETVPAGAGAPSA